MFVFLIDFRMIYVNITSEYFGFPDYIYIFLLLFNDFGVRFVLLKG